MKIEVSSFKPDIHKVEFTKLQRAYFGYSLLEAKNNTDKLLAGGTLLFEAEDEQVEKILQDMNSLGALAKIGKENEVNQNIR
jgi:ribosomal protein L7/L12